MDERETYRQLSPDGRVAIAGLKMQGCGVHEIGRGLVRSPVNNGVDSVLMACAR